MTEEEDRVDVTEAGTSAGWFAGCHLRTLGDDVGVGADIGVVES